MDTINADTNSPSTSKQEEANPSIFKTPTPVLLKSSSLLRTPLLKTDAIKILDMTQKDVVENITVRKRKRRVSNYEFKTNSQPETISTPLKLFDPDPEIEDLVGCVKAGNECSPKLKMDPKEQEHSGATQPHKRRRLSMPIQSLRASNFDPVNLFAESPLIKDKFAEKKAVRKRRSLKLPQRTVTNATKQKTTVSDRPAWNFSSKPSLNGHVKQNDTFKVSKGQTCVLNGVRSPKKGVPVSVKKMSKQPVDNFNKFNLKKRLHDNAQKNSVKMVTVSTVNVKKIPIKWTKPIQCPGTLGKKMVCENKTTEGSLTSISAQQPIFDKPKKKSDTKFELEKIQETAIEQHEVESFQTSSETLKVISTIGGVDKTESYKISSKTVSESTRVHQSEYAMKISNTTEKPKDIEVEHEIIDINLQLETHTKKRLSVSCMDICNVPSASTSKLMEVENSKPAMTEVQEQIKDDPDEEGIKKHDQNGITSEVNSLDFTNSNSSVPLSSSTFLMAKEENDSSLNKFNESMKVINCESVLDKEGFFTVTQRKTSFVPSISDNPIADKTHNTEKTILNINETENIDSSSRKHSCGIKENDSYKCTMFLSKYALSAETRFDRDLVTRFSECENSEIDESCYSEHKAVICVNGDGADIDGYENGVLSPSEEKATSPEQDKSSSDISETTNIARKTRSKARIRRNLPKLQVRHTPMGLPKPLREKKEKFSIEEIYLNKNFKTPTEKKWETIFEFPKENKDGTISNYEKRKKKRLCEFSTDPSQRKKKWKKSKVKTSKRKKNTQSIDTDKILAQKLFNLDTALKLADLSP